MGCCSRAQDAPLNKHLTLANVWVGGAYSTRECGWHRSRRLLRHSGEHISVLIITDKKHWANFQDTWVLNYHHVHERQDQANLKWTTPL